MDSILEGEFQHRVYELAGFLKEHMTTKRHYNNEAVYGSAPRISDVLGKAFVYKDKFVGEIG